MGSIFESGLISDRSALYVFLSRSRATNAWSGNSNGSSPDWYAQYFNRSLFYSETSISHDVARTGILQSQRNCSVFACENNISDKENVGERLVYEGHSGWIKNRSLTCFALRNDIEQMFQ